jgi:polysaccharide export outer membrane protein
VLVLALAFAFCLTPSGMAQQDASQPTAAAPAGWSEQRITDAEKAQQINAPEYVVGEGDVLRINVWKEPDVSLPSVVVRPDGMISVPLVGVVKVGGMTPSQIQDMMTIRLGRFLSKPQVTVTVTDIKSKAVYVTGEVVRPGVYPLVVPIDVLQAIVMAGGPTQFARRKSVFVLRTVDGKLQRLPVNYAKMLRGRDTGQNITLLPGDTIVVP